MRQDNPYNRKQKITHFKVREAAELMNFLLENINGKSRTAIKSLLKYRQISINGQVITQYDHALKVGDKVSVNFTRGNTALTHPKLKIIHEDQDFIVVDKGEDLLTVTVGTGRDITAFSLLKNYVKKSSPANKIYTVHRLDRGTSGVVLFSKNRDIQHMLRNNWHEIVTKRSYLAVVEGVIKEDSNQIVTWLTEDEIKLKVYSNKFDNGGKQAITNYKVLSRSSKYTLLELELVTGRKNQIRSQMEFIGHPIVGDKKYGANEEYKRIALHAHKLEFYHPVSHKLIKFKAESPKEFGQLMRRR